MAKGGEARLVPNGNAPAGKGGSARPAPKPGPETHGSSFQKAVREPKELS